MNKKTTQTIICQFCSQPIIQNTYYKDVLNKGRFHIECAWDEDWNNLTEDTYANARKFFFSLENKEFPVDRIGERDIYEEDLILVRHNDRISNKYITDNL